MSDVPTNPTELGPMDDGNASPLKGYRPYIELNMAAGALSMDLLHAIRFAAIGQDMPDHRTHVREALNNFGVGIAHLAAALVSKEARYLRRRPIEVYTEQAAAIVNQLTVSNEDPVRIVAEALQRFDTDRR